MYLPDVNVLIALIDSLHEHHLAARKFFEHCRAEGWATCAVTETGVIRILGHPAYPNSTGMTSTDIRELLRALCAQPGHRFLERAPSLLEDPPIRPLPASKHLTDYFLLATAVRHQVVFASFDQRIQPDWLPTGPKHFFRISTRDSN